MTEHGSNLPPTDADPLKERLHEEHANLIERRDELLAGLGRVPDKIEDGDEETAKKLTDFLKKQVAEFKKQSNAVHEDEKAPFLAASRTCDTFKHVLLDDIDKAARGAVAVLKSFADRKVAIERARREEEELKARQAAAVARRLEEEARARRDEEAARKRREAEEAAKKMQDEQDLAAAQLAQVEADRVEAENLAADKLGQEEIDRTEAVALQAGKAADAKPAEMGKIRGEMGGQTSLKRFWNFTDLRREDIDLEELRQHITVAAYEAGVRSWIKANTAGLEQGWTLKGVRIYPDTRL